MHMMKPKQKLTNKQKQKLRDKAEQKYDKVYNELYRLSAYNEISYEEYIEREHIVWKQKMKELEDINNDD